jgi:hypothetical protein
MRRARVVSAGVGLGLLAAACSGGDAAEAGDLRVAYVQDLSRPGAFEHGLPAMQGATLALRIAEITGRTDLSVTLVSVDVGADPEAIAELAADPGVVAVIAAPGLDARPIEAGTLPVVSLAGSDEASGGVVLPLVPPGSVQADALAADVQALAPAGTEVCLRGDRSDGFLADVAGALGVPARSGPPCPVVVWHGDPRIAADLAAGGAALAGSDTLLDPDFVSEAGPAAEGAVAVCGCADVSTSTARPIQRFVQDYQSEFGSAPGAYAVEGWDAATLIVRALEEAGASREDAAAWLARVGVLDGLERTYRFGDDGSLLNPESFVLTYIAHGGRWVSR